MFMKLRKIFAGMAASAIAMTAFAMSASALDSAFNAGVCFQSSDWTHRNSNDKSSTVGTIDGSVSYFPSKAVGVNGDGGLDTAVAISDAQIQYDGTYTVSIAASGTVNDAAKTNNDGSTTLGNGWALNNTDVYFQLLSVGTDLVLDDKPENTDDVPMYKDTEIKISNVTASWGSNSYTFDDVYAKGDSETLTFCLINAYDDGEDAAKEYAMPAEGDTISITFTISGLGADPNAGSTDGTTDGSTGGTTTDGSTGGTTTDGSTGGTTTDGSTNSTADGATNSTADGSTTTNNGGSTGTSKGGTSTTGTSSKSGSTTTATTSGTTTDNTANAESGAAAGVALAGIALAGAAIVVSKRK